MNAQWFRSIADKGVFYLWVMWRVMSLRPASVFPHLQFVSWMAPAFLGMAVIMSILRWASTNTPPMAIALGLLIQFGLLCGVGPRCRIVALCYATASTFCDALGILIPGGREDGPVRIALFITESVVMVQIVLSMIRSGQSTRSPT